ncbi:MFS transporter [Sphingopyxis macrogoltabida]|uniref:Major facilitator superfamily (MFS) profile domain-containing protein n=1 Tax=Sphingopyxis macrogoltabida TaxID=33050 RepID=A0AAC9AYX3_SPHMC|nr:MFS transporter [Sphingopyxis macrogoltabida]ALJ16298.1 hypothetical protein LH19_26210 [Sphingopyxis macrogoltabida]AMU92534.1 hypothetical protein ATM17_30205 [Sphingopyxis macrogoltabida]
MAGKKWRLSPERGWLIGGWYVVIILTLLYILALIDRLVLTLLIEPLKQDLNISDTAVSVLLGPSFAILYSLAAFPIAFLIDRGNRIVILCTAVFVWSAATIGSAFAENFTALVILRAVLAIGEAALAPAAISLIGDRFLPVQRTTPTAVFLAGGHMGTASTYFVGGAIIALLEGGAFDIVPGMASLPIWRSTLILVGIPGMLLAALLLLTTREPARGVLGTAAVRALESEGAFRSPSVAVRFYSCFLTGHAFKAVVTYSAVVWFPTYLVRTFDLSPARAAYYFGFAVLLSTALAVVSPIAVGKVARRGYPSVLIYTYLVGISLGGALYLLSLLQTDLTLTLICAIIGFALLGCVTPLPVVAIAMMAPSGIRARVTSLNYIALNVVGLTLGSLLVALFSDHVFGAKTGLGYSLITVTAISIPVTFAFVVSAIPPYVEAARRVYGRNLDKAA